MGATSIVWKVIVGVSTPVFAWSGCMLLCTIPWIQRQILYLHNVPMSWGEKLHIPESFGFLKNQAAPFYITTPDGVGLYSWLITPLAMFASNEKDFLVDDEISDPDIQKTAGFNLLKKDPESRLLIYFHGNSGTIGQSRRTDEYRVLSSGDSSKMFILTFDYRGFGRSKGAPTEGGILLDAISVVKWAMETAQIPPNRIVFLSQSLGTAVATATAEYFINQSPKIEFAGIILCAAFTDAADAFLDFSVLGKVTLLGPLRLIPGARNWFKSRYRDQWNTLQRLGVLVKRSDRLRLTLVHAMSDKIIPWAHCENLFYAATGAASDVAYTRAGIDDRKKMYDLGAGGWLNIWSEQDKVIRQRVLKYGGHDAIMKWGPVALLWKAFELRDDALKILDATAFPGVQ